MNICPIIVDDLEYGFFIKKKEKNYYCIGSREADRYFFVSERLFKDCQIMISYLDGKHTIKEIRELMNPVCQEGFDVDYTYRILLQNNLIQNEKYNGKRHFNEFDLMFKTIASFNISKFVGKISRIPHIYFGIIILLMLFSDVYAGLIFASSKISLDWTAVTGNPITIIFFMFLSTISVFLHEISHAITGRICGLSIKQLNITTVAYTSLGAYVKVPGIYFLSPYKRICIWFAGIYTNIFLLSLAIIMMKFSCGYLNLFALVLAITNATFIYSSAIPFYLSDGYFILATILKVPNLRRDSFFNLKKIISEKKLNMTNITYLVYLLITVVFSAIILWNVVGYLFFDIQESLKNGLSIIHIISNYKNFFLVLLFSIIVRFFYKRLFKENA